MKALKHRSAATIRVVVPEGLADLVPQFLVNRRGEAKALLAALAEGNFQTIDWIAQRMVGGGAMFGFDEITAIGRVIRCAAASRNRRQLRRAIDEYAQYLDRLRVEYRGRELAQVRLATEWGRVQTTKAAPRRHPAAIRTAELASEA